MADDEADRDVDVTLGGRRVRLRGVDVKRVDPLKETTEAKPRPPVPDDPRSAMDRNLPPYAAGGA